MTEDEVRQAGLAPQPAPWWVVTRSFVYAIVLECVWLGFFVVNIVQLLAEHTLGPTGFLLLIGGGVLALANVPSIVWLARRTPS